MNLLIMNLVKAMLREIGEDVNRKGLQDTPERVAKMYDEIFRGYNEKQKPKLTVFPNGEDGIMYNSMILDKGYFYSHCEHHMVPFFGEYFFAYIPDKQILGASKIARTVDYFAAKLQVQERLGIEVVDYIERAVEPEGIILVLRARHLCKEMRGVKKHNSWFETIEARGCFLNNQHGCKDEFMVRINS